MQESDTKILNMDSAALDKLCQLHGDIWHLMEDWMHSHTGQDGDYSRAKSAATRDRMQEQCCSEPTADETTHDLFMENLKRTVDKKVYDGFCQKYRAHQKHCQQLMKERQVINPPFPFRRDDI